MLGTSYSLEVPETVLSEESLQTEKSMASAFSRGLSMSGVLMEYVRIESGPCTKSSTARSKKEYSVHPGSNEKWVNVETLPKKLG